MDFKIIAVDFDGVLCEDNWPEIGEPNQELINYLKGRQSAGNKLILWTCRIGEILDNAIAWSAEQGLTFDGVNENLPEIVELFGTDSRKIFANEYIDDRNIPLASCKEKSSMQLWAEKEVEIACKYERGGSGSKDGEWDYGCACYESALKAYKSLCEDGHSGFSIGMAKYILNRLIEHKPLTPIEDTEDVWNLISGADGDNNIAGYSQYQCKRMSSLFKYVYPDGTVKYGDTNRYYGVNLDNPNGAYHSGLIDCVMDELYPIRMPYFPESKPFKVVCEEFLTDRKNGDFDTVGMLYAIDPNGVRVDLNRYFKESESDFVEIAVEEYEKRRLMYQKLLEDMKNERSSDSGGRI